MSYQAPKLGGQSVIGELPGHSKSRRDIVCFVRTSSALPPAAAAAVRSARNGSFWP
jgi:hypothetical protein